MKLFCLFLLFCLIFNFCFGIGNDPSSCNYRGIREGNSSCSCDLGYYGTNCTTSRKKKKFKK